MSRKKKKKNTGQGTNFVITLVTMTVVFLFIGYLIGQYAVRALQQQHQTSTHLAQGADRPVVTGAASTAPANKTPEPAPPTPLPSPPQPAPQSSSQPPVTSSPAQEGVLYRVQVGVFSERANAERMIALLQEAGYEGIILAGPPHRVQTGAFSSQDNAARLVEELTQKGFEAIIVR
jgi:cell division protein FtsN